MPEASPDAKYILALLEVVHDDQRGRHLKPIKRYDLRSDDVGPAAAFLGLAIQLAFDRYVRWRDESYARGEEGRAQFIADAAGGKWPECFPLLALFEALTTAYRRMGHTDNPMDSLHALYIAQDILSELPTDLFKGLGDDAPPER